MNQRRYLRVIGELGAQRNHLPATGYRPVVAVQRDLEPAQILAPGAQLYDRRTVHALGGQQPPGVTPPDHHVDGVIGLGQQLVVLQADMRQ